MILYYFFGGAIAVLSAITNVILVLGILASLGATLTLPGVAALVLTLGMGVDANILILERIREERLLGKSPESSLSNGFNKVISTILDANVTTLITALILFWLGTGPVKGFGLTMAIGIVASVFCALFVTRTLADLLVNKLKVKQLLGLNLLPKQKIDFFKFRKPAFLLSWIIVIVGVSSVVTQKDSILGIDFTGGDEMTIAYAEKISTEELLKAEGLGSVGEVKPVYQTFIGEDKEVLKIQTRFDQSREVLSIFQSAFPQANFSEVGVNQIGASVSQGVQVNALISVLCALVGILLYVAFRFELGYGVGAVVATIHDVLMTIGLFVLLGSMGLFVSGQFTAPMLAAILMIVGYSINDTIVVFDRIREELEMNPGMNLKAIINLAINSVFARSILTSITTLLAAVSLYIFGAGIITDFSFVFIVGILTGTFSSIFIASPIFYYWHKGDRRLVEATEHKPRSYDWTEEQS
jgi:SecD/SecF fusion protein